MNWTIALAAFGAATGAASLFWQLLNYRLTGGRIQILAISCEQDGHFQVVTNIVNSGRLDVSIMGYSVWPDVPGHRVQKVRWRMRTIRRVGLIHARCTMAYFSPSLHLQAPVEFNDEVRSVEFPVVLKAGSMITLPEVGIGWPEQAQRKLRVAVHLGSGKVVSANAISSDAFQPLEIKGGGEFDKHIGPSSVRSMIIFSNQVRNVD